MCRNNGRISIVSQLSMSACIYMNEMGYSISPGDRRNAVNERGLILDHILLRYMSKIECKKALQPRVKRIGG